MFSPSKDKIDEVYPSLQTYFKIEDDGDLNNYLRMDMDLGPDVSIYLRQPYLTQIILNMITGMDKSSANPNLLVKPLLVKNERSQAIKNDFNYRSVIGSLNFLKKFQRAPRGNLRLINEHDSALIQSYRTIKRLSAY